MAPVRSHSKGPSLGVGGTTVKALDSEQVPGSILTVARRCALGKGASYESRPVLRALRKLICSEKRSGLFEWSVRDGRSVLKTGRDFYDATPQRGDRGIFARS
ncbi:hypothetical protein Bbelb_422410 [Branchiostoma belcheri]|nr:hypothetical protein Bbelb_422410 [Branchiostoma belcheri]